MQKIPSSISTHQAVGQPLECVHSLQRLKIPHGTRMVVGLEDFQKHAEIRRRPRLCKTLKPPVGENASYIHSLRRAVSRPNHLGDESLTPFTATASERGTQE